MFDSLFTSRREFVAQSLTFLSAAATVPAFLRNTARVLAVRQPKSGKKNDSERILVVVQLAGGNDGLNTVVPYEMDAYYKARRQIAIAKKDVLPLADGLGLHPAATGLKELYDAGNLAIVQGVGYPNPNRSHFTSMDIWHTADPNLRKQSGWIGRYFDACCKGNDPEPEPVKGVALMQEAPLALQGEKFFPLAFNNPEALAWRAAGKDEKARETFRKLNNIDGDFPTAESAYAQFLQRAALEAQVGADEIRSAAGSSDIGGRPGRQRGRGGQLERQLNLVRRMIAADMPTRIYYVSMGGFDTHTGQAGRHRQLMTEFGNALGGFVDDLTADRQLDRVLIVCFSEFGRRVYENASGGTDHGEAAPMFLCGGRVKAGLHEKHPDLNNLHRGDLAFGCDFRRVYATVLQGWLGVKSAEILGPGFEMLKLIRPA